MFQLTTRDRFGAPTTGASPVRQTVSGEWVRRSESSAGIRAGWLAVVCAKESCLAGTRGRFVPSTTISDRVASTRITCGPSLLRGDAHWRPARADTAIPG